MATVLLGARQSKLDGKHGTVDVKDESSCLVGPVVVTLVSWRETHSSDELPFTQSGFFGLLEVVSHADPSVTHIQLSQHIHTFWTTPVRHTELVNSDQGLIRLVIDGHL